MRVVGTSRSPDPPSGQSVHRYIVAEHAGRGGRCKLGPTGTYPTTRPPHTFLATPQISDLTRIDSGDPDLGPLFPAGQLAGEMEADGMVNVLPGEPDCPHLAGAELSGSRLHAAVVRARANADSDRYGILQITSGAHVGVSITSSPSFPGEFTGEQGLSPGEICEFKAQCAVPRTHSGQHIDVSFYELADGRG